MIVLILFAIAGGIELLRRLDANDSTPSVPPFMGLIAVVADELQVVFPGVDPVIVTSPAGTSEPLIVDVAGAHVALVSVEEGGSSAMDVWIDFPHGSHRPLNDLVCGRLIGDQLLGLRVSDSGRLVSVALGSGEETGHISLLDPESILCPIEPIDETRVAVTRWSPGSWSSAGISVMSLGDGSVLSTVSDPLCGSLDPDADSAAVRLVFVRVCPQGHSQLVVRLLADGSETVLFETRDLALRSPRWTRAGDAVVFLGYEDDSVDAAAYWIPVAGGEPPTLVLDGVRSVAPPPIGIDLSR